MTALHVFDMDGTLLRGTTASRQIAAAYGNEVELLVLEQRFAAGEIDTRQFAKAIHALWAELIPATVAAAFAGSSWMNGIADVCADIRGRGERSAVITMSPDFFANGLSAYGFDAVVASRLPPLPFAGPVDPAAILTPDDKVRVVDELLERYRIDPSRCVAYGDSMSDAPLFRRVAATVAVNADEHLAGLAVAEYEGDDIIEAYRLGRAQLVTDGAVSDAA
jgi:phosphoserine phosphatase